MKLAAKAIMDIFKPKSPFLTATVMDILFEGIGIDCSSDEFEAKSFCNLMENEKAIKIVNDTYLTFSILGAVSCNITFLSTKYQSNIDVDRPMERRWDVLR